LFTCEICILAGGLSRRMGRDKTRLLLGKRTMLQCIKATARKTGNPVRVISKDLLPRIGPLGGVYTALKTTRYDRVLFLACDMPFVQVALLNRFLDKAIAKPDAIFMECNSRPGFPFLLSREALAVVTKQVEDNDTSLHELARRLKAKRLRPLPSMENQLRNVNTPSEWEIARKLWKTFCHTRGGPRGQSR
jgi:molybdopterin-guanine dinucleotide biosynthesis protein A